jgi:hypothetical protein
MFFMFFMFFILLPAGSLAAVHWQFRIKKGSRLAA